MSLSSNLVGVAYLLGHKQVTTTNRYARPNRLAAEKVLLTVKDARVARWGRVEHALQSAA